MSKKRKARRLQKEIEQKELNNTIMEEKTQEKKDNLRIGNLAERLKAQKPEFWAKVQKLCIVAGVLGGALMAAPVALPAYAIAAAPHLLTMGIVGTTLSQLTSKGK